MFVERIIYRGVVDGNDEFVWVMNLSGECTDTSAKYKIRGYDKDYADSLKSDKNFNIVARMMIPMEECKRFVRKRQADDLRRSIGILLQLRLQLHNMMKLLRAEQNLLGSFLS